MSARRAVPAFAEVQAALPTLDGTTTSAVALLTGLTPAEIDEVGGISSDLDAPPRAA